MKKLSFFHTPFFITFTQNKDNEKIIELMEQNVELNQLRTTLAKQIGDRIISPK